MTTTRTTAAPTLADQVAALLHDDGQRFSTADGRSLLELAGDHPHAITWRDGYHVGDVFRIEFADGSCITVAGDAWDFGFPGCFCWLGAGHDDECARG